LLSSYSQTAAKKLEQQWYIKAGNNTKIQLAGTTFCVDAGAKCGHSRFTIPFQRYRVDPKENSFTNRICCMKLANWKDMANLSITNCSDTADGQKWNSMADGRIALQLSSPRKFISSNLKYT
jgi:hypothetical protein